MAFLGLEGDLVSFHVCAAIPGLRNPFAAKLGGYPAQDLNFHSPQPQPQIWHGLRLRSKYYRGRGQRHHFCNGFRCLKLVLDRSSFHDQSCKKTGNFLISKPTIVFFAANTPCPAKHRSPEGAHAGAHRKYLQKYRSPKGAHAGAHHK